MLHVTPLNEAARHTCRRTYILPRILLSFFFFFLFPPLISELAERNSTKVGQMVGSKCNLKTHVQKLEYPLPLQVGAQNHPFRRFRNLTATLTAHIFGMKHGIHKRASVLQTTMSLLHRPKTTLVHKRLQIGSEFSPTLCKFCIPLHCQASQTEISKRNSTKLCQTMDGNSR